MENVAELKQMDTKQLLKQIDTLKRNQFKLKFELKSGKAKNSHDLKINKVQIARIQTILSERKLAENAKNE